MEGGGKGGGGSVGCCCCLLILIEFLFVGCTTLDDDVEQRSILSILAKIYFNKT